MSVATVSNSSLYNYLLLTGANSNSSQSGSLSQSITTTTPQSSSQSSSGDTVTLSSAAAAALAASNSASTSYYEQFMPTRAGFSSAALANAVSNPGAETISSGKTLAQVATAARSELDTEYAAMKDSGTPFDYNSKEGVDWYSLMGKLDRRALYAVSSNQGGQFTQQEQQLATNFMSMQQGLAMGLYEGPSRLEGKFVNPYGDNYAASMQGAMKFLDGVSNDEKSSISWNFSRASAQVSYDWQASDSGTTSASATNAPENPLLKLIESAMATMKDNMSRDHTNGAVNSAATLQQQPWFQGFGSQLGDAISQTNALYQSQNSQSSTSAASSTQETTSASSASSASATATNQTESSSSSSGVVLSARQASLVKSAAALGKWLIGA
jgi:hypothetical protein